MHPQRANILLQGLDRRALTLEAISGPTANLETSFVSFPQLWIYMVGKKYLGKADQSTLASGGSEHA